MLSAYFIPIKCLDGWVASMREDHDASAPMCCCVSVLFVASFWKIDIISVKPTIIIANQLKITQ